MQNNNCHHLLSAHTLGTPLKGEKNLITGCRHLHKLMDFCSSTVQSREGEVPPGFFFFNFPLILLIVLNGLMEKPDLSSLAQPPGCLPLPPGDCHIEIMYRYDVILKVLENKANVSKL